MTIREDTLHPSGETSKLYRSLGEQKKQQIEAHLIDRYEREQQGIDQTIQMRRAEAEELAVSVAIHEGLFPEQPDRWQADDLRIREIAAEIERLQERASDLISLIDALTNRQRAYGQGV